MAHSPGTALSSGRRVRRAQQDPLLVRAVLIAAAVLSVGVLVIVPTVFVFVQALRPGLSRTREPRCATGTRGARSP